MTRLNRRRWAALALLAGAALCLWQIYSPRTTELIFLNVGQGDAILLKSAGQVVLIDGGPDRQVLSALSRHLPFWRRQLSALILTHDHDDHLAGLLEVLSVYHVNYTLGSQASSSGAMFQRWLDLAKPRALSAGDQLTVGDCQLLVLAADAGSGNKASLVTRLDCGTFTAMLTGDAEVATETKLLASRQSLAAEVLKLGHHGSDSSTSQAWLEAVKPQLVVISVGESNTYGHPSTRTIKRLERLKLPWVTTMQGDIRLLINPTTGQFKQK